MTSKVIWSNIFIGVIEVIQHHKPISHSPCRCRYYRAIALLFLLMAVAPADTLAWSDIPKNLLVQIAEPLLVSKKSSPLFVFIPVLALNLRTLNLT